MARTESLTVDQIVTALKSHQGLVYLAADKLGVSSQTVYNYAKRYAAVREAIKELKGKRVDQVELALWNQINEGNITAIIFYLKTQAKDRGYVERQEVTGKDGGPVEQVVKIVKGVSYDEL